MACPSSTEISSQISSLRNRLLPRFTENSEMPKKILWAVFDSTKTLLKVENDKL